MMILTRISISLLLSLSLSYNTLHITKVFIVFPKFHATHSAGLFVTHWCPPISPNPNSPNPYMLGLGIGLGLGLGIWLGIGLGSGLGLWIGLEMGLGIGLGSGFDYFRQYNVIRRIVIRRNGAEPTHDTLTLTHSLYFLLVLIALSIYSFLPRIISEWNKLSHDVGSKPSIASSRSALPKTPGPVENINF